VKIAAALRRPAQKMAGANVRTTITALQPKIDLSPNFRRYYFSDAGNASFGLV